MRALASVVLLSLSGCVVAAPPPAPRPAPAPVVVPPPRVEALPTLAPAPPERVGMEPTLNARLDSTVAAALNAGAAPGAAIAVGRHGRLVHSQGYGLTHLAPEAARVTDSTLYDLASLTKVVATTTAAMILEDEGSLQLDRTVASYLPELDDSAKAPITVRMLLTHRGGLEAGAALFAGSGHCPRGGRCTGPLRGREAYLRAINERPLRSAPGTQTLYSDWDLVLLQMVIERITGQPLDRFVAERVFRPLGMTDTQFSPVTAPRSRVAPTQVDRSRGGLIHGEVHDGNAWALGGVAGHAGLFSSARDLAVFAQMLLNGGEYDGVRIVRPETLARWTAPQGPGSSRSLGWDSPSGASSSGRYFGPRSFGHTGFTGTSLWIDPERGLFVVVLTNRVYAGGANRGHIPLRRAVADAAQEAVRDAPLIDWEVRRSEGAPGASRAGGTPRADR